MVLTDMTLAKFTSLHFTADLNARFRNLTLYVYTSLNTYAYLGDRDNVQAGEALVVRGIKARTQQHHRNCPDMFVSHASQILR